MEGAAAGDERAEGGNYTFQVHNAGKVPHNLAIQGPERRRRTTCRRRSRPAATRTLKVSLKTGNYTLYCAVPGHKQLGMVAKLSVG